MSSVNKVILIGNLGNDPDVRTFDNGSKIANVSIATSETYKDKQGEKVTSTEWHRVCFAGKVVDVVEKYLSKGAKVYLEGKLRTRKYEQDGIEKYTTEIIAYNVTMLGGKQENQPQQNNQQQNNQPQPTSAQSNDDEDLPF